MSAPSRAAAALFLTAFLLSAFAPAFTAGAAEAHHCGCGMVHENPDDCCCAPAHHDRGAGTISMRSLDCALDRHGAGASLPSFLRDWTPVAATGRIVPQPAGAAYPARDEHPRAAFRTPPTPPPRPGPCA